MDAMVVVDHAALLDAPSLECSRLHVIPPPMLGASFSGSTVPRRRPLPRVRSAARDPSPNAGGGPLERRSPPASMTLARRRGEAAYEHVVRRRGPRENERPTQPPAVAASETPLKVTARLCIDVEKRSTTTGDEESNLAHRGASPSIGGGIACREEHTREGASPASGAVHRSRTTRDGALEKNDDPSVGGGIACKREHTREGASSMNGCSRHTAHERARPGEGTSGKGARRGSGSRWRERRHRQPRPGPVCCAPFPNPG